MEIKGRATSPRAPFSDSPGLQNSPENVIQKVKKKNEDWILKTAQKQKPVGDFEFKKRQASGHMRKDPKVALHCISRKTCERRFVFFYRWIDDG